MGERLIGELASATGLPEDLVSGELSRLISAAGISKEEVTLEDLRAILAEYVQDVLLGLADDAQDEK